MIHAGGGEEHKRGRPEPASADDQHARRGQTGLAVLAVEENLARIPRALAIVEHALRLDCGAKTHTAMVPLSVAARRYSQQAKPLPASRPMAQRADVVARQANLVAHRANIAARQY